MECPTCHSGDVVKITAKRKAARVALIGLLAANYTGKTFRCVNCTYTW